MRTGNKNLKLFTYTRWCQYGGVNTACSLVLFVLCQTKKTEKKSLPVFELFPPFFFFASLGVLGPSFPHSASSFLFCVTNRRKCRKSYIQGLLVICIHSPLEHYSLCFCFSWAVFCFFSLHFEGVLFPFFCCLFFCWRRATLRRCVMHHSLCSQENLSFHRIACITT